MSSSSSQNGSHSETNGNGKAPKVGIIGAGVFGCSVALELARHGIDVQLIDRLAEPIRGASLNNHNRVHAGFHYPRHLGTAKQSIEGYPQFINAFKESIVSRFPNRYFIASEGSHTTPEDYIAFLDRLEVKYQAIDQLDRLETPVRQVALGVETSEEIYDAAIMREALGKALAESPRIEMATNCHVDQVRRTEQGGLALDLHHGETREFDTVVNCSYADLNRLTHQLGYPIARHQFEYTAIPIVEWDEPKQGVTIMDGPFMSIMPFGDTDDFLLYHVRFSVVATQMDTTMPESWRDPHTAPFAEIDQEALFRQMCDDSLRFIPTLSGARLKGWLQGPRVVLANHDHDDARRSKVTQFGDSYYTVFSGKVDHCVQIAEDIATLIRDSGVRSDRTSHAGIDYVPEVTAASSL